MSTIVGLFHRFRGATLNICVLLAFSVATLSSVTMAAASKLVTTPQSNVCDATTPYGQLLISGADWARHLPRNTRNDGATYDVLSNYEATRAPQHCAGDVLPGSDRVDRWGIEFQCTELAIRVADGEWAIGDIGAWLHSGWNGSADDMFVHHPAQLTSVANGSGSLPRPGDIIVWSSSGKAADPGHVAVIAAVSKDRVTFVGENQGSAVVSRPLVGSLIENDGWKSGASTILGWLHGPAHVSKRAYRSSRRLPEAKRPVLTGPQAPGYEVAFKAGKTGDLMASGATGTRATSLSIHNATTPSITALTSGGFEVAFQESVTGHVWTAGSAGVLDTGFTPMPGTSPSIAALSTGSYEVAMQTPSNDLITVGPAGMTDWNLQMSRATSPSIVGVPGGGYEVAFQSTTDQLYVVGTSGIKDTEFGMLPGTSPSIAAFPNGGYEVAFQSNTGQLWVISATGGTNTALGMSAGTSPSIVAFPNGGYEVAFQSNRQQLWTWGSAGGSNTELGMSAGTSPSIAALPGGNFSVVFQSNTHYLWRFGVGASGDSGLTMSAETSPSVAALPIGYRSWPVPAGPPEPV